MVLVLPFQPCRGLNPDRVTITVTVEPCSHVAYIFVIAPGLTHHLRLLTGYSEPAFKRLQCPVGVTIISTGDSTRINHHLHL